MKSIKTGDWVRVGLTAYTDPTLARLASIWAARVVLILDDRIAVIQLRGQRFRIRLSALDELPPGTTRLPSVQPIPERFKEETGYDRQHRFHLAIERGQALLEERRAG
jgi:hypothetical protein